MLVGAVELSGKAQGSGFDSTRNLVEQVSEFWRQGCHRYVWQEQRLLQVSFVRLYIRMAGAEVLAGLICETIHVRFRGRLSLRKSLASWL